MSVVYQRDRAAALSQLAAAYPQSIFLTYNGPEFNDCFPDLPTLYIYPGPRGRT